jgi:4a-hydroxytetrahydrobiopterin dehydratase
MSQPAKSVMVAPSRSCTALSGVSRTVEVTCLILAVAGMQGGMATLTSEQVASELAQTPDWTVSDGQLTRTVTRKDFRDALLFVNAVGFLAERANHHPDIAISWNKVTLNLVSHSAGGLTGQDFALAREISELS